MTLVCLLLLNRLGGTRIRPSNFQGRHNRGVEHCIRETLYAFETVSSAPVANHIPGSAPKQQPLILVPGGEAKANAEVSREAMAPSLFARG